MVVVNIDLQLSMALTADSAVQACSLILVDEVGGHGVHLLPELSHVFLKAGVLNGEDLDDDEPHHLARLALNWRIVDNRGLIGFPVCAKLLV